MLWAFPATPAIEAGARLQLHVAGDAAAFRIAIEHCGSGEIVALAGPFRGGSAPSGSASRPWDWPAISIDTERRWPAGAYVARAIVPGTTERGGPRAGTPDARWGTALFVVGRSPSARVLVNLPLFTYHAYNVACTDGTSGSDQGACLYSGERTVTLLRPGGGTGGHPWDEVHADAYDSSSPRQTFAHWDCPALRWFAREGVEVDVCTDVDLHRGDVPLERYGLLCSFGHDEYWTPEKRSRVEAFLDGGGNVAFFGANTCWFRVRYDEAAMTITRDGRWCDDAPEDALTGLSYRSGGGKWVGKRPPTGYAVESEHPFTAAAGLYPGDVFGAEHALIGYEADGIDPDAVPAHTCVLARASLRHWDVADGSGEIAPGGHAAMVTFAHGLGTVFNAGTADWARCLARNSHVSAITRAVVEQLQHRSSRSLPDRRGEAVGPTMPSPWTIY